MTFPDVQRVLKTLVLTVDGVVGAGPETPGDLQQRLSFVRATRVGGGADRVTDSPVVDVDVFADRYDVGWPLAAAIRDLLLDPPHVVDGAVIDTCTLITGPMELPWSDPGVRRFLATYRFTLTRQGFGA